MMPVHQGVIKAEAQPFGAPSFNVLTREVTAGALLWCAVVGDLRIEISETLVVLGSHHHVFLSGLLRELSPGARGVWFRLKTVCELPVFRDGSCFSFPHPFV